eukprot:INCI9388.2.p1 GENE.INCI9388.2~~INCI9388.2.p1  ORF type:complete len:128 (-),score=21.16 INCI9388.2:304-687(-)
MSEGAMEVPLHQQDTSLCASRGGKPSALQEDEIAAFLKQLSPKWELSVLSDDAGGSVQVLRKQLLLKDFASALDAVNKFGAIAEAQNHHPNLHIVSYRTVIVELYTFSVKGLALNDFIGEFVRIHWC